MFGQKNDNILASTKHACITEWVYYDDDDDDDVIDYHHYSTQFPLSGTYYFYSINIVSIIIIAKPNKTVDAYLSY